MKIQVFETYTCAYCGAEDLFDDDINDDDKCSECVVEDCNHRSTWKDYISSNNWRAIFQEHCTECKSWRTITVDFAQLQAAGIDQVKWQSGDVE